MNTVTGNLVRQGKRIMVELPTKKGTPALFPIPESAKRFRDEDFTDRVEVEVNKDDANRIVEVRIVGAKVVAPVITQPQNQAGRGRPGDRFPFQPRQPVAVKDLVKASAKVIGGSFTNPYTFLPFDERPFDKRDKGMRVAPTLLTADEVDSQRLTGIMRCTVTTRSPLMSCDPVPEKKHSNGHKVLKALTIKEDVIVPATGVRGALRTLLTVLTGGTLGYVDPTSYLIQGRDAKLGPAPVNQRSGLIPWNPFLGEVVTVGNSNRPGKIRLGSTRLIRFTDLERVVERKKLDRSGRAASVWIGLDEKDQPVRCSDEQKPETPWRLRLSGAPVGGRKMEEKKREGIFKPSDAVIDIPAHFWAEYLGRNAGGDHSELRVGDLVWLEPSETIARTDRPITCSEHIKSLQWSRWGRTGEKLEERIPKHLYPDSWNLDGKGWVDEVTNLFGQVNESRSGKEAISFAGRIRPENVVFQDAKSRCQRTVLAPMSMPHPGCLAFYREEDNPDEIGFDHMLRGYKVYRSSLEQGADGPWNYSVQGVYEQGRLKLPMVQAVNQTVDLLSADTTGTLNIAFRGLTQRELALLVQACEIPWRLGGGKPLGLGACTIQIEQIVDELGGVHSVSKLLDGDDWKQQHIADIQPRVAAWTASQQPVPMMRYPRAIKGNSRGGHAWFGTHARPRMVSAGDDEQRESGLAPIYIGGELKLEADKQGENMDAVQPMISGQVLPVFDPDQWQTDLLYGYDMVAVTDHDRRNTVTKFDAITDDQSNMGDYNKHSNQSHNKASRDQKKKRRD